jgi:hypothetical protein
MPVDDRALPPGTVLVARYKGKQRRCAVVETKDGLRYRLDDGTEHLSPSGAARAVAGGVPRNGWRFWSIDASAPRPRGARTRSASPVRSKPRSKGAR